MVRERGGDRAISESLSGVLIVILIIICAGLIISQVFGLFAVSQTGVRLVPVTDFSVIDGKNVMRFHHGGGDTAILSGPMAQHAQYHLTLFIETRDGMYEVAADESLKDPVFATGDTLVIFRAPDSYRYTDTPEAITPAGSIPSGPFSLRVIDETRHVMVAALGENGWEFHEVPVPTVAPPVVTETETPGPAVETPAETAVPTEVETTVPVVVHTPTAKVTPRPTTAKTYPVYLNTQRPGYLAEGGMIRFRTTAQYSYIRIKSSTLSLSSGDDVQLTLGTSGGGKIYMTGAMINTFTFDDVLVSINGDLIGRGSISELYINGYTDFRSTLSLWVPSRSASTDFRFNGVQVFSGVTNSPITVNGLSPGGTNGVLNLDAQGTRTYVDGGATDYVLE